jgi:uncharacterized protein
MLILPEPGAPFHRLARTTAHRWWRPVLGTLALAALWIAEDILDRVAGPSGRHSLGVFGWLAPLSVALLVPAAMLAARYAQGRPAGTVSSVLGRTRQRWLDVCLLVAAAAMVVLVTGSELIDAMTGYDKGPPVSAAIMIPVAAVLILPTVLWAVAAEYVFRGWLLQAIGAFGGGPWPAIAVQAVLFGALNGTLGPWSVADWVVTGAVLGWLAVRTGGLEAGIALMVAVGLTTLGYQVIFGWLFSDGDYDDMTWQFFALDVVVMLAYAAVVDRLARRRGIATVSPEPTAAPEPIAAAVPEHA